MSRIAKWKLEKTKVQVVFRLQFHATRLTEQLGYSVRYSCQICRQIWNPLCWRSLFSGLYALVLRSTINMNLDEVLVTLQVVPFGPKFGRIHLHELVWDKIRDRIPQPGWDKLLVSFIPADSGKAAAKTAKANVRNGNCKWSDPIYETTRLLQDAETKKYDEKLYKIVVSMGSSRMSLGEAKFNLADYAESSKPSTVVLPLQGCKFGTILHVTIQLLTSKVGFREFEQQRGLREKGFRKVTNPSVHDDPDVEAEPLAEAANDQIDKVNARTRLELDSPKSSYLEEKGELNKGFVDSAVGPDGSPQTLISFHAEKHDGSPSCNAEVPHGGEICNRLVGTLVDGKTGIDNCGEKMDDGPIHDLLVRFQKELLLMEDTLREMQNKVHIKYQEKDLAFLQPDLEMLEYVLHSLKERTSQVIPFRNMPHRERISQSVKEVEAISELAVQGDALEQQTAECYRLGDMFCSSGTPHQMSQDLDHRRNNLEAANKSSDQVSELLSQLEKSKAECETLSRKTTQIECRYKPMIQDQKESEKELLDELQHLRDEHSSCICTIDDLKGQMERMCQDMNEEVQRYTEDRCKLDDVNKELQKRVMTSETTFNRVHQHYSIAVGQLQKDLELLSCQVISLFETNNKVSWQPFVEASETYCEFIEDCPGNAQSCLQKDGSESAIQNEQHEMNLHGIQEDIPILREAPEHGEELEYDGDHTMERMFPSLKEVSPQAETISEYNKCIHVDEQLDCPRENKDSKLLKEEAFCGAVESPIRLQQVLHHVTEQAISENFVLNLNCEVFSSILQETLCELNVGIRLMRKKMGELAQQLEDSTEVKESLLLKLQTAVGDIETLRETESRCITKCNELSVENISLQTKLKCISDENYSLNQKVVECQRLVDESRTYMNQYEACFVAKNELEDALKQEREEKGCLQNEIVSLSRELKALKEEFDKQSSVKEGLEKTVTFLQTRLENLRSRMVSHNEETNGQVLAGKSLQLDSEDKNFTTIFWHLEELQQSACSQVLRLKEENMEMKQKLESDVRGMEAKLDAANVEVKNLQLELQDVEGKLMKISEVEEKHAEENVDSSKLRLLEVELQHVTIANKELNQKIQTLEGVDKELGSMKLTAVDLGQENEALVMSLHAAGEDPLQLEKEIGGQRVCLGCTRDKFRFDGGLRDKLEATFSDQTAKVNEKQEQKLSFDDKEAEFVHIREHLSDLHFEDSRVRNVLLHSNECQRKVDADASFLCHRVIDLDAALEAMHEYLLAAEVEVVFTENQFHSRIEELLDVMNKMNGPLRKMQQFEENAELMASVHWMKYEPETNIKEKTEQVNIEDERNSLGPELEKRNQSVVVTMESEASQEKHGHEVETEQLKRMPLEKVENDHPPEDMCFAESGSAGLRRELLHGKEQLESICSSFEECSGSGHALERALGLEIELAKASHSKKKSDACFEGSFLEQHNDDESAIFKSFKDMNDLSKEMLEIKRKHAAVEAELKEMQERYSQLSLQFAEVEGERQQLIMELKNVKLPKKS